MPLAAVTPAWAAARPADRARRPLLRSRTVLGPRRRKVVFTRLLDLFAWGLKLTPLYRRGVHNALDLRRTEFEVAVPGLPAAFDGLTASSMSATPISDVLPDLVPAARRLLDGVEVDLLALTGDVHGDHHAPVALSADHLMEVLRDVRVNGPRLAILGNHDSEAMADTLERLGLRRADQPLHRHRARDGPARHNRAGRCEQLLYRCGAPGAGRFDRGLPHRPDPFRGNGRSRCRGGLCALSRGAHPWRPDLPAGRTARVQHADPGATTARSDSGSRAR